MALTPRSARQLSSCQDKKAQTEVVIRYAVEMLFLFLRMDDSLPFLKISIYGIPEAPRKVNARFPDPAFFRSFSGFSRRRACLPGSSPPPLLRGAAAYPFSPSPTGPAPHSYRAAAGSPAGVPNILQLYVFPYKSASNLPRILVFYPQKIKTDRRENGS